MASKINRKAERLASPLVVVMQCEQMISALNTLAPSLGPQIALRNQPLHSLAFFAASSSTAALAEQLHQRLVASTVPETKCGLCGDKLERPHSPADVRATFVWDFDLGLRRFTLQSVHVVCEFCCRVRSLLADMPALVQQTAPLSFEALSGHFDRANGVDPERSAGALQQAASLAFALGVAITNLGTFTYHDRDGEEISPPCTADDFAAVLAKYWELSSTSAAASTTTPTKATKTASSKTSRVQPSKRK